jgi:hypothetical protein
VKIHTAPRLRAAALSLRYCRFRLAIDMMGMVFMFKPVRNGYTPIESEVALQISGFNAFRVSHAKAFVRLV